MAQILLRAHMKIGRLNLNSGALLTNQMEPRGFRTINRSTSRVAHTPVRPLYLFYGML